MSRVRRITEVLPRESATPRARATLVLRPAGVPGPAPVPP
ncbi:MAG: hypothetical protein JWO56_1890, partial [Acidobacteria bacterium]|nr:hypothetical protein [Acidobacteriota bacterium]